MEDIAANLLQSDSVIDLYMITIVLPFSVLYNVYYLDNYFYISPKTGWRNR